MKIGKEMFGNQYNPDCLKDVKGNILCDCDLVESIFGFGVVIADYTGLYLNDTMLLGEETIATYKIVKKKTTPEKFAVRMDCPSPCNQCSDYDKCVCRQQSIKSRFAVISNRCSMYAEYYLMKLKHDNENNAK